MGGEENSWMRLNFKKVKTLHLIIRLRKFFFPYFQVYITIQPPLDGEVPLFSEEEGAECPWYAIHLV